MKKVLNFVKGKKDEKGAARINPQISVEITNPSGQKIPSDDEHIIGLQQGFGYNIDPSGKDKSMLKIHKASWLGQLDKVKLHAKKNDINTPDSQNRTCLHLAVAQGHTEVAWFLLNNNASITACDNDGMTPFLKAIECGQKDCTNLLIECGVEVNSIDGDGNSGLHIASRSGFYNIASLLLKEGANVNVPNNSGNYPLHAATSCDHRDIVELLIKYGANVQAPDRERRTALMLASRNGLCSIIKVLLENEALLDTTDSNGWTAEDYAQFGGHHDLIELLQTKKKEASLEQSDKLSVHSSDQSEHINFEVIKTAPLGNEDSIDSPRSCIIPPPLEPPRSWDLLQSGVIDQEGSLENRKSLLTLGNLKRGNSDIGSCELIVSPADVTHSTLSPSGDIPADMRLSPEPLSLAPTPERRTRSPLERAPSVDLPSDSDSPLQGFSNQELNSALKHSINDETCHGNRQEFIECEATTSDQAVPNILTSEDYSTSDAYSRFQGNSDVCVNDKKGKIINSESHNNNALSASKNRSDEIDCSTSLDVLEEKSLSTDNQLSGVSSSLGNIDCTDGKSLSIEIVQSTGNLDDTLSITTTKNVFRESHSLELLGTEVGDTRSYKNNKRHHRNKSITLSGQPQLWNSVSTLPKTCTFDRGSIDAQLMCYDEALRQLANVKKIEAKDAQINTSPDRGEIKSNDDFDQLETIMRALTPTNDHRPIVESHTPTDELEYLDRDNFPPPPIHFLQNEDLSQIECDDKSILIDVLPMPISMLTPIKETQVECDSLSVAETFENELTLSERSNIKSESTPNHFNVEVIVNNKAASISQSFDEAVVPGAPETTEATLQLIDDVFIEDPTLAEPYDRYFVDLKTLEMVPSAVDFNKIVFPADSPSPKKTSTDGGSDKIPNKSDSESECFGKPLRKKRKLLLAMRAPGVGGSKDTDNDIDEEDIDSDEEDPPFWQNTEKGGFFIRQDTIVAKEPELELSPRRCMGTVQATLSTKILVKKPLGSPSHNSEAETASASDTPRLSPMGIAEPSQSHLGESSSGNCLWEEQASVLIGSTARLKYELEDARHAEAERSDTISILQCQLSRLEAQYSQAQEEVCMLKQKADSAELELKHLRDLCACLSRDKNEPSVVAAKQLVDQATASTPTEDDYRHIHMQIMIKHLEDSKKLEEDKNNQLVKHLEEVLKTNQIMINEKEVLIAQNIADVRKLQEDTLCWKERYEELAGKLELLDKRLDPRLIEAQDTIATLKRTIAILQLEKSYTKRGLYSQEVQLKQSSNVNSKNEEQHDLELVQILQSIFGTPCDFKMYKVAGKTFCPNIDEPNERLPTIQESSNVEAPSDDDSSSISPSEQLNASALSREESFLKIFPSLPDDGPPSPQASSGRSDDEWDDDSDQIDDISLLPNSPESLSTVPIASSPPSYSSDEAPCDFEEVGLEKQDFPIYDDNISEECSGIETLPENVATKQLQDQNEEIHPYSQEQPYSSTSESDENDYPMEDLNAENEKLNNMNVDEHSEPSNKNNPEYQELPESSNIKDDNLNEHLVENNPKMQKSLESNNLNDDGYNEPSDKDLVVQKSLELNDKKDGSNGEPLHGNENIFPKQTKPAVSEEASLTVEMSSIKIESEPVLKGLHSQEGKNDSRQELRSISNIKHTSNTNVVESFTVNRDSPEVMELRQRTDSIKDSIANDKLQQKGQVDVRSNKQKRIENQFERLPAIQQKLKSVENPVLSETVAKPEELPVKLELSKPVELEIQCTDQELLGEEKIVERNLVPLNTITVNDKEESFSSLPQTTKILPSTVDQPMTSFTSLKEPQPKTCKCCKCKRNKSNACRMKGSSDKMNPTSQKPLEMNDLKYNDFKEPSYNNETLLQKSSDGVSKEKRVYKKNSTYFDNSSPPFPKNSLEVLHSPFYSHWSYFDVDNDHPISSFIKRTEFSLYDPTDHIIIKNARMGGYNNPYVTIGTHKKISANLVFNDFKNQSLDQNPGGVLPGFSGEEPVRWNDGKPVASNRNDIQKMAEIKQNSTNSTSMNGTCGDGEDSTFTKGPCCGRDNCSCYANVFFRFNHKVNVDKKIEFPTPCDSCKCFINDVAPPVESTSFLPMPPIVPKTNTQERPANKYDVNDYIANLQEQCSQLCSMLGKIRYIMKDDGSVGPVPQHYSSQTQVSVDPKSSVNNRLANDRGSGDKRCTCNKSAK